MTIKYIGMLIIISFIFQPARCQITDEIISQLPAQDMLDIGIITGNLQTVKSAISKGADINYLEKLPLCTAIRSANRLSDEENEMFVAMYGITPPGRTAYIELTKWLLQNGANPNPDPDYLIEKPPLLLTAECRDLEITRLLLNFKANPNIQDQLGNTALHILTIPIAIALPYEAAPEIAKLLISNGAWNIKNDKGNTPLADAQENLRIIENTPFWQDYSFYNNLINSYKNLIDIYSKF